jgi:AcrR family transcriptional regulator
MLELVRNGEAAPSAEQVAEKAGVGRRTVFRLFSDMEGVFQEPMFLAPFVSRSWRDRLDEIVERRARMYEEMLPVKSAADAHRYRSNFLQTEHRKLTRLQRNTMLAILPTSVASRADLVESLDLTLSFEAWRRLRQEQGLSAKRATGVLKTMLGALLD